LRKDRCSCTVSCRSRKRSRSRSLPFLLSTIATGAFALNRSHVQPPEHTVRRRKNFFVLQIFTSQNLDALAENLLHRGIRDGLSFAFHASQFFQVAAPRLPSLGLKFTLQRFLNLKKPNLAGIRHQRLFNPKQRSRQIGARL
jgi:hypothetical protein